VKCKCKIIVYCILLILIPGCEKENIPTVDTLIVSEISNNSAICEGAILSDGGAPVSEAGICWGKFADPTVNDSKTQGSFTENSFSGLLSGLEPATAYAARAYAINSEGVGYGKTIYFTTFPDMPSITTSEVSSITLSSAVCGGFFQYGDGINIKSIGICYNDNDVPTIEDAVVPCALNNGAFTAELTGLGVGIIYHVRSYAIFSIPGMGGYFVMYGNEVTFITSPVLPEVITMDLISTSHTKASVSGWIVKNGASQLVEKGFFIDTVDNPVTDKVTVPLDFEIGVYQTLIENLKPGTEYYYRAYAINSVGTAYGETKSFITYYGTVSDVSGNVYTTIRIGNQIWMKENLRVKKYSDNTDIQLVTSIWGWGNSYAPAYCFYYDYEDPDYGALYNYYAVNTEKLCPSGWHVPTFEEWTELRDFLGGTAIAGQKMKESGTEHWIKNQYADNSSHFTALPGGIRTISFWSSEPGFTGKGYQGNWWSTYVQNDDTTTAVCVSLKASVSQLDAYPLKKLYGLSVRCIKDN